MSEDYLKLYAGNLGEASNHTSLNNLSTHVPLSDQLTPQLAIHNFLSGGSSLEQIALETPCLDSDDSIFQADTLISSDSVFPLSSATNTHEHQLGSPVDTLIGNQLSPTLEQAFMAAYNHLKTLVSEPDFISKMNVAFGNSWNLNEATTLLQKLSQGNALPAIVIVPDAESNRANGAFESVTNTIYLSSEFIAKNVTDPEAIADVILEEIGHYIDSQINIQDSAGDEGAIFSALAQGKTLDKPELIALKTEDDTATIWRNGQEITIEMSQIALESFNGRLYQSHRGFDNNIYTRSSVDGVNWTGWNNNGGGQTPNAPALEAFNGRLYQSHRGYDNNIYTRSSIDGVNWTGWNNNGGGQTPSAPTLAAFNGRLYQSHRGYDNNIYTRSSIDGVNWTGWNNSGGGQTPTAPELEAFNGRLYQSHRGFDNNIYTRSSIDGVNWTGWNNNGGGQTPSPLELEAFNNRLYQSHRGYDNNIYTRSSIDGVNWTGWNNNGGGQTPSAPEIEAFNGRLYQSHQGLDYKVYTRSSIDGVNWTGWVEQGGLTPNDSDNASVDRLTQLNNKSLLTIDEIREYRQLVTQKPESERAGWYRNLQYKVPYFNQRDNASTEGSIKIGDYMCNVTTLASSLTYLGVKNPNTSKQFEDVLEDTLRANPSIYPNYGGNARYWWSNLSKLATNFGVASSGTQYMQGFSSTNLDFFKNFVKTNWEPALKQGKAIMSGVYTTQVGHIVKVLDIDWNRGGIIVDDPYGQAQNSAWNDYKRFNYSNTQNTTSRGAVNTQQGQNESGIGNDNFWSWSYCAEVFGDTWYLRLG